MTSGYNVYGRTQKSYGQVTYVKAAGIAQTAGATAAVLILDTTDGASASAGSKVTPTLHATAHKVTINEPGYYKWFVRLNFAGVNTKALTLAVRKNAAAMSPAETTTLTPLLGASCVTSA